MAKSKTFDSDSEISEVMSWFMEQIKTEDYEIITGTPAEYDVETRTVKKYKITIQEYESHKIS